MLAADAAVKVLCLLALAAGARPWGLGGVGKGLADPLKTIGGVVSKVKNDTAKGLDTVKEVGQAVLPSPSAFLDGVSIPAPEDIASQVSELVLTTSIFKNNNESLNCFGLPIKLVDKALEKIFMQSTDAKDVRFYFSSRRSPNVITYHSDERFNLEDIRFDVRRPTFVVVHGFMSSGKESWTTDMKNAFLRLNDANAIVVDWQKGSNTWNYYSAAVSTRIVGLQIAKLFAKIHEQAANSGPGRGLRESEWGPIWMVGHSLGAHISAYASYLIKESQKGQPESWIVGRITGLDPAQPCFSIADESLKLDKDDAPFVDVIHTNARNLLFLGLGLPEQLGFVDFYPNGGKAQPGCVDIDVSIWSFLLLPANLIKESVCSHGRSHTFLTESVINLAAENCTFYGYAWDRKTENEGKSLRQTCTNEVCVEMGASSSNNYPYNAGVFYVPTRANAPYCLVNDDTNPLLKTTSYEKNIRIPKKYPST